MNGLVFVRTGERPVGYFVHARWLDAGYWADIRARIVRLQATGH